MCGIIGYIGSQQVLPILIAGLERLEYRGYDSAGVAIKETGDAITVVKQVGKVENLKQELVTRKIEGTLGIGHTRWATHGGVTNNNAHPHFDYHKTIALIHNGIIENYSEIKERLVSQGHQFSSETDTEVLAHLIGEKYRELVEGMHALGLTGKPDKQVFLEATRKALTLIDGAYSIVVIHKDHPDCIVAARLFSPLILGLGKDENFIASDIPAILQYTNEVVDLGDEQIACVTATDYTITDIHGNSVTAPRRTVSFNLETAEKQGYPHFLIKEIHESSRVIQDVIRGKIYNHQLVAAGLGLSSADAQLIQHVQLIACGTAYYACLIGKYLFEQWAGVLTEAITASEYRYHTPVTTKNSLVIGVSQSGETADTMAGLRKVETKPHLALIGLTNVIGSSLARMIETEHLILLNAGPEISVASTKAFTSMVMVQTLLALFVAREKGLVTENTTTEILDAVEQLPAQIDQILDQKKEIARVAMQYVRWNSMYFLGRGINYPTALEGALKLKEISYIHAEGYPAGEMKHGPIAVLEKGFPVVAIATKSVVYDKMLSNIQEAAAREADLIILANPGDKKAEKIGKHCLWVPETREELSPILNNIVLQLFAYYTALYKGYSIDNPRSLEKFYPDPDDLTAPPVSIDIDKPRNLAKSVTVE
ncbi:MAG: glutamine--fructose-6-phosphate transaminase (isomerizing) [bacterium]